MRFLKRWMVLRSASVFAIGKKNCILFQAIGLVKGEGVIKETALGTVTKMVYYIFQGLPLLYLSPLSAHLFVSAGLAARYQVWWTGYEEFQLRRVDVMYWTLFRVREAALLCQRKKVCCGLILMKAMSTVKANSRMKKVCANTPHSRS